MSRPSIRTSAALALAACCLAACGSPKAAPAAPAVDGVSATGASEMAQQFCDDLAELTYERAIERMATRASAAELSSSDQDAIVDHAAALCPEQMP